MPWIEADATRHTKKADTARKRKTWANVANDALARCLENGRQQEACEASAIRQANAAIAKMEENNMDETLVFEGTEFEVADLIAAYREAQSREKERKAKTARAKKYGISQIDSPKGNLTKPSEYEDVPDDSFGDPVNYKYPADAAHARAALGYFNQSDARTSGGYSEVDFAKVGRRLATLISKHLTADYVYRAGKLEQKTEEYDALAEAVSGSLDEYVQRVKDAFRAAFGRRDESGYLKAPWARDVFKDDAELGDAVVVADAGTMYAVGYEEDDEGALTFDDRAKWTEVVLTYKKKGEPAAGVAKPGRGAGQAMAAELGEGDGLVTFSESAMGHVVAIAEDDAPPSDGRRAPLKLEVALIRPGWGNAKDKHFYPADVLRRDAAVFEGAKMYATDHRPEEKSVRTEVATITGIARVEEDGTPIGLAAIHDPDFAEQARNREELGTLEKLECSILGKGRAKEGEIDGVEGNIVETITAIESVDWVTRGGAGGRALNIAESEREEAEVGETREEQDVTEGVEGQEVDIEESDSEEPQSLSEDVIAEVLDGTTLPEASKARLAEAEYETRDALDEAIGREIGYIKELTGSGAPVAHGGDNAPPSRTRMSADDYTARLDEIDKRHGLRSAVLREQDAA